MAFSTGSGPATGRGRFRGGAPALAEINIVPFVDVVLVLLVIFMLTAHVMEYGLEVDVPKTRETKETVEDLPIVAISRTGDVYLNDKPANINSLGAEIKQRFGDSKGVYVRADKGTIWDPIAQVISMLNHEGLKVRMVTQPDDGTRRSR